MTLSAGANLGPYEVVSLIARGGMGEVYRCFDPRLGREVGVKILAAGVGEDPDRLRRFEQEARAAAALNHPNILTIHEIGTHDGQMYVVFELLQGETLREALKRGALPVKLVGWLRIRPFYQHWLNDDVKTALDGVDQQVKGLPARTAPHYESLVADLALMYSLLGKTRTAQELTQTIPDEHRRRDMLAALVIANGERSEVEKYLTDYPLTEHEKKKPRAFDALLVEMGGHRAW